MAAAKSAQRRQDLLQATSRVISERGLSGVSVRTVAEQAQMSAGSVLYHFESFDQLIDAAVRGAIEEFIDNRRRFADAHRDPLSRLRATIEAGIPERISDDLRIVYEASAAMREQARFGAALALLLERQVALYNTIIEVGMALGTFRPRMDPLAIASNLVALEDAYDLYLLDPANWQRDRYLQNTMQYAELALDCVLIEGPESVGGSGRWNARAQDAAPETDPETDPETRPEETPVTDNPTAPAIRARDLGIEFDGEPGRWNAITDVPGVEVGYVTLVHDEPEVVRTGVTAILPRGRDKAGMPCAAGVAVLNGNGELTGRSWIEEAGQFQTPLAITNSHAVGAVHCGIDRWLAEHHPATAAQWMLPVVGETWDGYLNSINADAVRPEHAIAALDAAASGPLAEGNVGGGTGMNCYGFKGGTGTASRIVRGGDAAWTVGVLLQANFGSRRELRVAGHPLGRTSQAPNPMETTDWFENEVASAGPAVPGAGSVIVVVATDAPLLPDQCRALARRVPLGLARTGTTGSHFSGDIFLAFSTANEGALASRMGVPAGTVETLEHVSWGGIDAFYTAVVEAVEEAVLNALVAARDMEGRDGHVSFALPPAEIRAVFETRGAADSGRRSAA